MISRTGRLTRRPGHRTPAVGWRPRPQQGERLGGRRGRLSRVDRHRQAGFSIQRHRLVGEAEVADDLVVEPLGAGAVDAHVMAAPPPYELGAAGGQLADQVVQGLVVWIAARRGSQDRHVDVRRTVPVREEVVGPRVEEDEPAEVRRTRAAHPHVQIVVHRPAQQVGGQQVVMAVDHDRRAGDRVQGPLQARPRRPPLGRATRRADDLRRSGGCIREVEQVRSLCVVELQGACDRVEHLRGHTSQGTSLHLGVVLDADPRQRRHLDPAQPGNPPCAHVGEAGQLGRDPGPPRHQERSNLSAVVHDLDRTRPIPIEGCPARTPHSGDSLPSFERGFLEWTTQDPTTGDHR